MYNNTYGRRDQRRTRIAFADSQREAHNHSGGARRIHAHGTNTRAHTHTLNLRQQEYREEKKCIWTFDNLQLYGFAFQGQTSIRLRYIGRIVTSKCIQRRSTLYISTIYIDLYANVLYVICTKCVICSFHLATVHRYETVFICSFCRRAHTFGLATDSCRYKAT